MTIVEMQKLKRGDIVKVQADDDIQLEEAVILDVGDSRCMVIGDDPKMGRFYMPLRAARIISKVEDDSLLAALVKAFIEDVTGLWI